MSETTPPGLSDYRRREQSITYSELPGDGWTTARPSC